MEVKGNVAFGAPGMEPRWTSSSKDGIGTAYHTGSRLWFTLSHGIVNEIYFPCIDQPNTRDLQLLVSDGEGLFHEERRDLVHSLHYPEKGALAYQVCNADPAGRYEIHKTILSGPYLPVLLIDHQLVVHDPALQGRLRVYLLIAPHLRGMGAGNSAEVIELSGSQVLHAFADGCHLVCGSLPALRRGSAGYVGASDGYQDISRHGTMRWEFGQAPNGNVALCAELAPDSDGRFLVAVGLGGSFSSAATVMAQSLAQPVGDSLARFARQWSRLRHEEDECSRLTCGTCDSGSLYRLSRCILSAHEDKLYQGSLIASMSIPWGEARGDEDLGGYHLVWPRDMLRSALAMLYSGQRQLPLRALIYMACIQPGNGSMPQNCWIDGTAYWPGRQLDESAAPVILARQLDLHGALLGFDPWEMVLRAVGYLLLNGPATGQERWEENGGYSPSTLASVLAAVVAAAGFAGKRGEPAIRELLFDYADWLRANLEPWTCTSMGTLDPAVPRHFVRIVPGADDGGGPAADPSELIIELANGGGRHRASDILDAGFLELVRFGFIAPDDPLVTGTLQLVDRELKVDFPHGPCWRRYQFDGYGSHPDGRAFDGSGYGGCWPLLTGERGHYELAAGGDPLRFLQAMENFANDGGMLPEQVWPLPDAGHMRFGKPSGSAMPLCWAHAEYVTLVHSRHAGRPLDQIEEAWARYVENPPPVARTAFWSLAHRTRMVARGMRLVVLLSDDQPLSWRWATGGDWQTVQPQRLFGIVFGVRLGPLGRPVELRLADGPAIYPVRLDVEK